MVDIESYIHFSQAIYTKYEPLKIKDLLYYHYYFKIMVIICGIQPSSGFKTLSKKSKTRMYKVIEKLVVTYHVKHGQQL